MHKHINRTRPITFTMFCLLILGILVLLAACGSSSSTSTSPSSSTATSNPAPPTATTSGNGKYGNGGSNTTPTATTAPTGATQAVTITTDSSGQFTFSPKSLTASVGTTVSGRIPRRLHTRRRVMMANHSILETRPQLHLAQLFPSNSLMQEPSPTI
ncbi:MAG: hypothetical protein M3Y76_11075, partial [Chloroflexota bacterium]|nr:hypothetical protein [Chloroflexota bacterium]